MDKFKIVDGKICFGSSRAYYQYLKKHRPHVQDGDTEYIYIKETNEITNGFKTMQWTKKLTIADVYFNGAPVEDYLIDTHKKMLSLAILPSFPVFNEVA